jgi:hypothetical protein
MPFYTRPNFEDRQIVQYSATSITLSGNTNINQTGQINIFGPILDFTGTTTASTLYTVAGLSGYLNYGNISGLKVEPPVLYISGSTGTTTVDITGYYLGSLDSGGTVTWITPVSSTFTGGTGSCITDLYVTNIHGCSPITIWDQIQYNGSSAITQYSTSFGYLTKAEGNFSHSEGYISMAIGDSSHAEGDSTIAQGSFSHAEGQSAQAIGQGSHAEGRQTIATGDTSHAEGYLTKADGDYSHSEGRQTSAIGYISHAEGGNTIASGNGSHAEGSFTSAFGDISHSEGYFTVAIGNSSHAEGFDTISGWKGFSVIDVTNGIVTLDSSYGDVTTEFPNLFLTDNCVLGNIVVTYNAVVYTGTSTELYLTENISGFYPYVADLYFLNSTYANNVLGDYSHAENESKALGISSHAEGTSTSLGYVSHAEGFGNYAMGTGSHAEGNNTRAIGSGSHSQGYFTVASGDYSYAGGNQTHSIGDYSFAMGQGLISDIDNQSVFGKFNVTGLTSLFVIGNGSSSSSRSNLLSVTDLGIGYGVVNVSGKTITTNLQITSGATAGYVLTALDSDGNVSWQIPGGSGGTTIVQFTGNTSASCITDLYVHNLYGCSPILLHDTISGNSTNNYFDISSTNDNIKLYTKYSGLDTFLSMGSDYNGVKLQSGTNQYLQLAGGGATFIAPNQIFLSTNNKSLNQLDSYGLEIGIQDILSTGGSIFSVRSNSSAGSLTGGNLTGGTLQSEIILGKPNASQVGLPSGVMGTGLGTGTNIYGVVGYDFYPVFISTPRSRAYDTSTYSSIKNVLFGGGSDNSVYSGTTNSSLIGGSGNTITNNLKNVVVLGGEGITATTSNTVYVPDLIIKKSNSVPTTSGDTVGDIGSVTWDNNYLYVKTNNGWGRVNLDYSW